MNLTPYLGFVFTAQLMHMHQPEYEITHHTFARIKALPVFFWFPLQRLCKIFLCTLPIVINHKFPEKNLIPQRGKRELLP
jgi:hypothetical protein